MADAQLMVLVDALQQKVDDPQLFLALFDRLEETGDSRLEAVREFANLECPMVAEDEWPEEDDSLELLLGDWWCFQLVGGDEDGMLILQLRPHSPLAQLLLEQPNPDWYDQDDPGCWPAAWRNDDAPAPWQQDSVERGDESHLDDRFRHQIRQLIHAYLTLMPS